MKPEPAEQKQVGWAEQLKEVIAEAGALTEKMRRLREVLPPVQSGMALRLEEFEQTMQTLLKDDSVQLLLKQ